MQRLFNVEKWQHVGDGSAISFANPEPRRVRIDVNAPLEARIYYAGTDGEVTFLANVFGRDVLEFRAYGEFSLTIEGSDVWFYTVDGEDYAFSIPDAVILTKLAERKPVNKELEMMKHLMNRNIERRLEQQRDELERLWDQRTAAAAAARAVPSDQGVIVGDSLQSQSTKRPARPAVEPEPADAGDGATDSA